MERGALPRDGQRLGRGWHEKMFVSIGILPYHLRGGGLGGHCQEKPSSKKPKGGNDSGYVEGKGNINTFRN